MSPDQYFTPLIGQSLLYPGQAEKYRGQCVQSVTLYILANGTIPPRYPSAYLYYDQGVPGYVKIPAGAPIQDGDIVVWSKDFPPAFVKGVGNGHMDVATGSGTLKDFWAYDSNWQPPLKLNKIHHNGSDNKYIVGYLRKEGGTMLTQQQVLDGFQAYGVKGEGPGGSVTQDQLDKWSSIDPAGFYVFLLDQVQQLRKDAETREAQYKAGVIQLQQQIAANLPVITVNGTPWGPKG